MTATADYSDGKVPKNETAFPLCRATDSLWNKNVVSLLSAVIGDASPDLLHHYYYYYYYYYYY